jgi:hypothetical protein
MKKVKNKYIENFENLINSHNKTKKYNDIYEDIYIKDLDNKDKNKKYNDIYKNNNDIYIKDLDKTNKYNNYNNYNISIEDIINSKDKNYNKYNKYDKIDKETAISPVIFSNSNIEVLEKLGIVFNAFYIGVYQSVSDKAFKFEIRKFISNTNFIYSYEVTESTRVTRFEDFNLFLDYLKTIIPEIDSDISKYNL